MAPCIQRRQFAVIRPAHSHKYSSGADRAASQANWTLLTLSHYVDRNASEIGNPVGVGFFARRDTAVDDATLTVVPEPTTVLLVGAGLGGLALLRRRRRE